jgi:tetratricopeptide (TPR) repeat protein
MRVQLDAGLSQIYEFLEAGNPGCAKPLVEDALAGDLENEEIIFALRCVHFWIDKIPVTDETGGSDAKFENGEQLIYQWKHFLSFAGKEQAKHERVMRAICKGVFSAALDCYEQALNVYQTPQKSHIYRRAGLCYKKLGEYERALSFLAEANKLTPDQSEILAEMADCFALCGDERSAKVLFREAFFIAPLKIESSFLDSEMIRRLIEIVAAKEFTGSVLLEWVPVYGVLYGVFTVKRDLRPQEAGKLKQAIYSLETEIKETGCDHAILVPKLINHYFWFIDYLISQQEDRSKVEETLLKIKLLDAEVHKKYTGIKPA